MTAEVVPIDPREREVSSPFVNFDAEQALLGAIMANETVLHRVETIVSAADFADPLHGRVFETCRRLVAEGKRPDPISLKTVFDRDGALKDAGGAKYLMDLALAVVTIQSAPDYAVQIADLAARRRLVAQLDEAKRSLHDFGRKASDIASEAVGALSGAAAESSDDIESKWQVMERVARYVDEPVRYFSTGISGLDDLLGGGLYAGKLYALAARKKAGKTALLGTISAALNAGDYRHGFMTLEISPLEIEMRQAARKLGVSPINVMRGVKAYRPVPGSEIAGLMPQTTNATFYSQKPGASLDQVTRFALSCQRKHQCAGIIVDYWQLITGKLPAETEEWHLRRVAQSLADLARRLGIWILTAVQLNQDGNSRGGEGIKLACDAYLSMHREPGQMSAWLELEECRYAANGNLGDKNVPGLILQPNGPYFEEA
jgi:replicative DNA helicase